MERATTVRGFHDGELAVQRRAGVEAQAARLTGMLAPADLRGGLGLFLAGRTYAAISARDAQGRLWVSPLAGPPGFLVPTGPDTLEIHAAPVPGDPLHGLPAGQPVGLLVIEYAARRRARVNGTLVTTGPDRLVVDVAEAYGNCPQYIPPRCCCSTRRAGGRSSSRGPPVSGGTCPGRAPGGRSRSRSRTSRPNQEWRGPLSRRPPRR